jgi:hypothetical protein
MISRSYVATPARTVSMSLLVGLRVSSCSPPMDRIPRPMPRFDRSASMTSSSAVLGASLSGLVVGQVGPGSGGILASDGW